MKELIYHTVGDVAEMLYQSMTDHDVGWADWHETTFKDGKAWVVFTPIGYNTTGKKFKIIIEEA